MQTLLWQLTITGEYIKMQHNKGAGLKQQTKDSLFNTVFALNKISRYKFGQSLSYYMEHQDLLVPVLDSLFKLPSAAFAPPPDEESIKKMYQFPNIRLKKAIAKPKIGPYKEIKEAIKDSIPKSAPAPLPRPASLPFDSLMKGKPSNIVDKLKRFKTHVRP